MNSSVRYLEKPIVSFTPIIPRVWQRSVDRDLVADVLVESIVLQLWFSKEKKGVTIAFTEGRFMVRGVVPAVKNYNLSDAATAV